MRASASRLFEALIAFSLLALGLYTLYTGPGRELAELARTRLNVDVVRPLANIAVVAGVLLLLDTLTGLLSRALQGRFAYKELAALSIPFYIAGASLIALVIARYDLPNTAITLAYTGGLVSLYIALWLTGESLTSSPLSLEIRSRGLGESIPWYIRLSRLKIRSSRPVDTLGRLLAPLADQLYKISEGAGLPYTTMELQALLGAIAFASLLAGAGIALALLPWAGPLGLSALLLMPAFLGAVSLLVVMKREERRERGERNALWLALVAGIASRLGIPLHRVLAASGLLPEAAKADRLLAMGGDPLAPLLSHPSEKVRAIVTDYRDIAESGGDPSQAMADWQERLLEEHRARMQRYVEEATTLLEALLIMLGLGPLIVLLAGTLQGSLSLLRVYVAVLLPLGIAAAAVLAERLPRDEAARPPAGMVVWPIAGAVAGVSLSVILGAPPSISLAAAGLAALALHTLRTRGLHDAEEAEKREAPTLLRILAESSRAGAPLLRAIESRAIDARHPHIRGLYTRLAESLRRTGELRANTLHDAMRRTLHIARLMHQSGASPYEIERVKRYIEAIIRAERDARARLRVLIALIPLLPFIIVYSLKLAASHITSLNTIPSVTNGELHGGSLAPPPISWELIRVSIVIASLGLGMIAGRIYYGRWDNVRLALLSVASALLALLFLL